MSFNPSALNIATVKKFVDRLENSYKERGVAAKRTSVQEDVAKMLGFSSYHEMSRKLLEKDFIHPQMQPARYASVIGAQTRAVVIAELTKSGPLSSQSDALLNDNTLTVAQLFLSDVLAQSSLLDEQSKVAIARSIGLDKALHSEDVSLLVNELSVARNKNRYTNIIGEATRNDLLDVFKRIADTDTNAVQSVLRSGTLTVEELYYSDAFAQMMMLGDVERTRVAKVLASDPQLNSDDVALLVNGLSFASQQALSNPDLDTWRLKKMKMDNPSTDKNFS